MKALHVWKRPEMQQRSNRDKLDERLLCWCTIVNSMCRLKTDSARGASRHVLKPLSRHVKAFIRKKDPNDEVTLHLMW